ncbi:MULTISPECIES: hypothetical protein [Pseudofrankia]|uniref:hypothetical protein n=1 Tax=Pseudofrankia TaxID=2994363 RepID=UPI0002F4C66B|nr:MULTISPECIES: hypothetical protein [Pseudofrankia]OHV39587.1 hypothetical protein BCD49_11050 [Pseudofrankia sp. EUN1h]
MRTELFKITASRGQRNAIALFLLLQIPMLVFWGAQASPASTWDGLRARSGLLLGYLLMALGAQIAASEFRWRTATLTWLVTPARHRVLGAQLLTVVALGAALSTLTFTAWVSVGVARHDARTMRLDRPGELAGTFAVVVLAVCAAAVVGVAVGSLTRGPSAALLGLVGVGLLELVGDTSRFRGPVSSPLGVLAWPTSELDAVSLWASLGWAAAATAAALVALRRDLPG